MGIPKDPAAGITGALDVKKKGGVKVVVDVMEVGKTWDEINETPAGWEDAIKALLDVVISLKAVSDEVSEIGETLNGHTESDRVESLSHEIACLADDVRKQAERMKHD